MIRIVLMLVVMAMATAAPASVGEFRGYATINQTVFDRVIAPGRDFELGLYLIDKGSSGDRPLLELLGFYDGRGLTAGFKNGSPNAVGMLLWQTLLTTFSHDIGKLCAEPKTIPQSDSLKAALAPLCTWPAPESRTNAALFTYWLQWMNFDAPYSEFEIWRDFFLSDAFKDAPVAEVVSAMTLAMLMNPHFLLQK